jgi:hypothetical protein
MEDRLSLFVMGNYDDTMGDMGRSMPKGTNFIPLIRGLAAAVSDINNLFVDLKHTCRAYTVSVFHGEGEENDDSDIDAVRTHFLLINEVKGLSGGIRRHLTATRAP